MKRDMTQGYPGIPQDAGSASCLEYRLQVHNSQTRFPGHTVHALAIENRENHLQKVPRTAFQLESQFLHE
jgi:hypothetical protein